MVDLGHRIRLDAALSATRVPVVVWADRSNETVGEGEEVAVGSNTYIMLPEDGDQAQRFLLRPASAEGAASGEVSVV